MRSKPGYLPPALSGARVEAGGKAGRLNYYVAGEGAPMLLVHSINAAASAYEVSPIFEAEKARRRVYAVDLPGFGFSDRSERPYTIRLYVDAILAMLDEIARECGSQPVDAVALSLGAEFAARAAVEHPERFRTLTLVTPTGFDRGSEKRRGDPGASREIPGLKKALEFPLWRKGLYQALVSRRSMRFFLKKTFGSDQIDQGLFDYDYLTAHQPGARHAPYAFVSGRLFSADIRNVYERLTLPVLVAHGTRGDFADFSGIGWTANRANWRIKAFETGALPHFEQPQMFIDVLDRFLGDPPNAVPVAA